MSLEYLGYLWLYTNTPHDSWRSHEVENQNEMDEVTQKDTRQTEQKNDNALSENQPKVTKNARLKEANFVKKQVSQ